MALATKPWDTAEFLGSDADVRHDLAAAFEGADPALIRHAFSAVTRACGMTALARDTGLSREALYKAFGANGNPTLDTLLRVTRALEVRLAVAG